MKYYVNKKNFKLFNSSIFPNINSHKIIGRLQPNTHQMKKHFSFRQPDTRDLL
jgi:hypothetical protein